MSDHLCALAGLGISLSDMQVASAAAGKGHVDVKDCIAASLAAAHHPFDSQSSQSSRYGLSSLSGSGGTASGHDARPGRRRRASSTKKKLGGRRAGAAAVAGVAPPTTAEQGGKSEAGAPGAAKEAGGRGGGAKKGGAGTDDVVDFGEALKKKAVSRSRKRSGLMLVREAQDSVWRKFVWREAHVRASKAGVQQFESKEAETPHTVCTR